MPDTLYSVLQSGHIKFYLILPAGKRGISNVSFWNWTIETQRMGLQWYTCYISFECSLKHLSALQYEHNADILAGTIIHINRNIHPLFNGNKTV